MIQECDRKGSRQSLDVTAAAMPPSESIRRRLCGDKLVVRVTPHRCQFPDPRIHQLPAATMADPPVEVRHF